MPARLALTQVSLRRGDAVTALKLALEALEIAPGNKIAKLLVAAGYLRNGRYSESRKTLEEILKDDPRNVDCLLEIGVLNLMEKRYEESREVFLAAYNADPSNLRGLVGIAETYFLSGEQAKAVQVLVDAAKEHPKRRDIKKELANAEARAKEFDNAINDYQAILPLFQDSPMEQADLYSKLGQVDVMRGKRAAAVEDFRKATELAPKNESYKSQFAQCLDVLGRRDEAIVQYRAAEKINPNDPIILNNLAFLLVDTGGDLDEAMMLAERGRPGLPESLDMADTLGWIYFKKDLLDKALPIFQDLVQKAAQNPTFHYHLAAVQAKKGNREEALKELRLALLNQPNTEERQHILELQNTLVNAPTKP
jgi:tetratricopeptide (TPR) repeat protein